MFLYLQGVILLQIIRNGKERGEENCFKGEKVTFEFENEEAIEKIRLVFDSDLNREYDNMPSHHQLDEKQYRLPKTLVMSYEIYADGKLLIKEENNFQRLRWHNLNTKAKKIEVKFLETRGDKDFRIFAVDLI